MKSVATSDILRCWPPSSLKPAIGSAYPQRDGYTFRGIVEYTAHRYAIPRATVTDLLDVGLSHWFLEPRQLRGFALKWAKIIVADHVGQGIELSPLNQEAIDLCERYINRQADPHDLWNYNAAMRERVMHTCGRLTNAIGCAAVDSGRSARFVITPKYLIEQLHDTLQLTEQ